LIRIIYDSQICDFSDTVISIPIDRHDVEISFLTGIIDQEQLKSNEITQLSNTYVTEGKNLNINPTNIDKYLWEIGNQYCNNKHCDKCPLSEVCHKIKR